MFISFGEDSGEAERERRRVNAGTGVCVCPSVNVEEKARREGVKTRRGEIERRRERRGKRRNTERKMSERMASCGSLYDSTNLLLQYCNNGEAACLFNPVQ